MPMSKSRYILRPGKRVLMSLGRDTINELSQATLAKVGIRKNLDILDDLNKLKSSIN